LCGFLKDRRDLGVGDEVLPALPIPVEEHQDPVALIGIAIDGRTSRPVLLSLLGALGREDFQEAVEILDLRRLPGSSRSPLLSSAPPLDAEEEASLYRRAPALVK
jgi:hypothetical protein